MHTDTTSTTSLPGDVTAALEEQYPCRSRQISLVACLLSPQYPAIPVVVHGPPSTAKTSITRDILSYLATPHAIIPCNECITGRHLFEWVVAACIEALEATSDTSIDRSRYSKCESLAVLLVHLEKLLLGRDKFVLVLDGVDQQREAPPTLLAGLSAFEEYVRATGRHSDARDTLAKQHQIPNLSIVFIISNARPGILHRDGVPHIEFPAYDREESLSIICRHPLPIFQDPASRPEDVDADRQNEDDLWLWSRFCATVWDSQARYIARDVVGFRSVAEKLWRPFVAPIVEGACGTRDFSRLIVANRSLFQSEDLLADSIVPKQEEDSREIGQNMSHDLPYYSKYLLCAAYLASYNPPRTDSIYFMKYTEKRKRKRGGTGTAGRTKNRKIPRRLLAPSPFTLERLLAIFHAVLPHDVKPTVDLYTQFATLASLRLVVKAGLGNDALDPSAKWKVNTGWDYVLKMGRGVGLELNDYVFEGHINLPAGQYGLDEERIAAESPVESSSHNDDEDNTPRNAAETEYYILRQRSRRPQQDFSSLGLKQSEANTALATTSPIPRAQAITTGSIMPTKNAPLTALQTQWTTLYSDALPAAARESHGTSAPTMGRWPVHLDHCFARIILDNAVGVDKPWTEVLKAPATRNMSEIQLRKAIGLGEKVWSGEADLWELDRRSLEMRGKKQKAQGGTKRKRTDEAPKAETVEEEPKTEDADAPVSQAKKSRKSEMAAIWSTFSPSANRQPDARADAQAEEAAIARARERIAADGSLKPFRRFVLSLLTQVPRGRYTTYQALGDAAQRLDPSKRGMPKESANARGCARAIGSVMRNNPFAPAVPCHRVLASDGKIGGFKGDWGQEGRFVQEKLRLLREEGVRFDGKGRVVGEVFRGFV